jgi:hypothetical protein
MRGMTPSVLAPAVLMVRPAAFGFNPQTAATNRFQSAGGGSGAAAAAAQAARAEFDALAAALRSEGIETCVVEDECPPARPDAVFPNNWISFHADGSVVLYPLQAPNRRLERREDVVRQVTERLGFSVRRLVDLTHHERHGRYLEGTGSLVLDHAARRAFACRSPRTDAGVAAEWARALDYELVLFEACAPDGTPPYHTNVVLWIGARCAGVYAAGIASADRARVLAALGEGGRELIVLDAAAIADFAGNMLELGTWDEALGDASVLVMSARARAALDPATLGRLRACADVLLAVPVPTIETLGGGSVRCMLAEVPAVRK